MMVYGMVLWYKKFSFGGCLIHSCGQANIAISHIVGVMFLIMGLFQAFTCMDLNIKLLVLIWSNSGMWWKKLLYNGGIFIPSQHYRNLVSKKLQITIATELTVLFLWKQHVTRGIMALSTASGSPQSVNLMHPDQKMAPSESGSWAQLTVKTRRRQLQMGRRRSG